jgi:hypothetical protein
MNTVLFKAHEREYNMECTAKESVKNEFHSSCTNAVADLDQDWSACSNILEESQTD